MKYRLANGLQVVLEENHAAPVVAFQAWVRVGAADEPRELAGIAHVFEHMLFKGTQKRGVGAIAREVEGAGGEINAWTSHDETVYHLVLASAFFDTGLDILADALTNSSFDPAEFERERKVVLEEIKQGKDDPDRVVAQTLFATAFDVHNYGRPVIGSVETVGRLGRADLVAFFKKHYVAANLTLVVVGDFDTARARAAVEKAFGAMAGGRPMPPRKPQPGQRVLRTAGIARDVKEVQLLFGFRTPGVNHEDIPALDVLAVILGQGDSSRLNLEVVRNRQMATTTSAYVYSARDPGLLVVSAALSPARVPETARAVLDEILRLSREPTSPDELAKARTIIESDRVYDKETVQGYARKLGFFAAVADDLGYEDRYFDRLRRLGPADLQRVAARYLRVANLTVVSQVPEAQATKQKDKAEKTTARLRAMAEAAEARADARASRRPVALPSADAVVEHAFPSGLKLIVLRDPSVPVVALRATWVGGIRHEDARTSGISNLVAGLLTRGTKTRSAEQIMTTVESMAGNLSGYAGRNSLGIQAEFLSRFWEQGLDLVIDCLQNATFSDQELGKERRVILDDIRAQEDNLGHVAFQLFHSTLWRAHPYRLDPMGTADTLAQFNRRKLLAHFHRHYGLSNLTIAVVGDVDPDKLIARLSNLPDESEDPRPVLPSPAPEPGPVEATTAFKFLSREQAHLVIGFPGTTFDDPDRVALEILSQVLSGQGGRLFVEIREKRALAYRVSAFSMEGLDPGYFAVYVAASPSNLDEAVGAIRAELKKVLDDGISADELARAKRYLVGTHAIGLQRKSAIASAMAFHEAYGQGWDFYRRYAALVDRVGAEDVLRVARKYLDPRYEVVAVVKPGEATPAATARTARAARAAAPAPLGNRRPPER